MITRPLIIAETDVDPVLDGEIAELIATETDWSTYHGRSYGNVRPTYRVLAFDHEGLVAHQAIMDLEVVWPPPGEHRFSGPHNALKGLGALVVASRARGNGLGPEMITAAFEALHRRSARYILASTRVKVLQDHLYGTLGFLRVPSGIITWQEAGALTSKDRFFGWTFDDSDFPTLTLRTGRF